MAKTNDQTIIKGNTLPLRVTVTEADERTTVDLTGASVCFTIKPALDADVTDAAAVLTLTNTTHENAVGGVTRFVLTGDFTRSLDHNLKYYYDVKVYLPGGQEFTVVMGALKVALPVRLKGTV